MEQGAIDAVTLDECLGSHLIEPALLRTQDFDGFYRTRKEALLGLIAQAMGKSAEQNVGLDDEEGDEVVEPDELIDAAA